MDSDYEGRLFSDARLILFYREKEGGRNFQMGKIMFIKHGTGEWKKVFRAQSGKIRSFKQRSCKTGRGG